MKNQIPSKPGLKFGTGVIQRRPARWETGIIRDYRAATRTYVVQLSSGREPREMPRLVRDPGDTAILPRDTLVVVHDELGFPVIDSVLPQAPTNPVELAPTRVSEVRGVGGEDPVYAPPSDAATFRQPNDPTDVLSGDRVMAGQDGNLMAVLTGGTNVVKSSPFAQVRTHALNDMVEIISRVYRHITAMGDLRITNDGGKTSLIWRAGADQSTENGAGEENWTLRLDAGATGDLFNFEVTTPHGNTLAKIHMAADGRLEFTGVGGVDITSSADLREDVAEDKVSSVGGDYTQAIKGSKTEKIRGTAKTTISKNASVLVGNSLAETVNDNHTVFVGGAVTQKIGGGPAVPPPAPGNVAHKIEIINGGSETVLGNPLSGALPTAQQSANQINYVGGYNFVVQPSAIPGIGSFNVITATPGSVNLGATGAAVYNPTTGTHKITAVAPYGAMLYEPFFAMIQQLAILVDSHVHPTALGPSGPPVVPTMPVLMPMLPLIRSKRVNIGL